jgi:hypothetical protein
MVELMGGRSSQGYELFQHLAVKAFLAIRPYADQLVSTVQLMLGTGLPSFKGEPTIKRLRDRFALGLNERQAAEWMMGIVRNAHENVRSTVYDEFQRVSFLRAFRWYFAYDIHSFKMVGSFASRRYSNQQMTEFDNLQAYPISSVQTCIALLTYHTLNILLCPFNLLRGRLGF